MKRIINVDRHLPQDADNIIIASIVEEKDYELLYRLGFSKPLINNECIIPNALYNKKTEENVNGKLIIRKDLPRDEIYYQDVHWKLTDWYGYEHEGVAVAKKFRYRREFGESWKETLQVKHINQQWYVCSRQLNKNDKDEIKFVLNFFLSIFGQFMFLDEFNNAIKIVKNNFKILRPGEMTQKELEDHIINKNKSKDSPENVMLLERFRFLMNYSVDKKVMIGEQSFHGYYAIKTAKCWIVDCNYTNNATYIFDDNWEEYVKLTKQQVLSGNLCLQRIYHTKTWQKQILDVIK